MSWPLLLGCVWIVAAALTAMLPMRGQMVPGLALLVAAPALLVWIGWAHGWLWLALGLAAFGSMFRNPLRYLFRRALGQRPELPPELAAKPAPELRPELLPELRPELRPELPPEPASELPPESASELPPELPPEPAPELPPELASELVPKSRGGGER